MTEIAGHKVQVRLPGTPTAATNEATTHLTGKIYQITNAAKRILSLTVAITIKDSGVTVAPANILAIDYLFGKVTFVPGYTVNGAVTFAVMTYLPTTVIAYAKAYSLEYSRDVGNVSIFGTAYKKKKALLADAKGTIDVIGFGEETITSETLAAKFSSGTVYLLEIDPDGAGTSYRRQLVLFDGDAPKADVAGIVEDSMSWSGCGGRSVDGYPVSFGFGT